MTDERLAEIKARVTEMGLEPYPIEVGAVFVDVHQLIEEIDRLREAGGWEVDHQTRALEALGLAEEYPWGCDSIRMVAEDLLELRAELAKAKARAAFFEEECRKRADLLDDIEWADSARDCSWCPWCHGEITSGHDEGCSLAQLMTMPTPPEAGTT